MSNLTPRQRAAIARHERDRQFNAARTMRAALEFVDQTFSVSASGGSRSKPTIAQLNAMWERVEAAIKEAEDAGIEALKA